MAQMGEDLLDRAFDGVTDEQIESFRVKTGKLRVDSNQIASNIRQMSRLQLLVEVLQRVHRMLSEIDRAVHGCRGRSPGQGRQGDQPQQSAPFFRPSCLITPSLKGGAACLARPPRSRSGAFLHRSHPMSVLK